MEAPITDIVFVCTPGNVPKGYTLIKQLPNGDDAQLWEEEPVLGGEVETRYLCYTKDMKSENLVIEDMYISEADTLDVGYEYIAQTVEGKPALKSTLLAVKKVLHQQATQTIVDIMICNSDESIGNHYAVLRVVNKLLIVYRTAPCNSSPSLNLTMTESEAGIRTQPRSGNHRASIERAGCRAASSADIIFNERPITDVIFVRSLENVPEGYISTLICPRDNPLRRLKKRKPRTRYLCYSKDKQSDDDFVVVRLHIHTIFKSLFKKKGYHYITKTIEGQKTFRKKQLAIKKVPRAKANSAVVDIIVMTKKDKDKIPEHYKRLKGRIKHCRIAYKTAQNCLLQSENKDKKQVIAENSKIKAKRKDSTVSVQKYLKTNKGKVLFKKMINKVIKVAGRNKTSSSTSHMLPECDDREIKNGGIDKSNGIGQEEMEGVIRGEETTDNIEKNKRGKNEENDVENDELITSEEMTGSNITIEVTPAVQEKNEMISSKEKMENAELMKPAVGDSEGDAAKLSKLKIPQAEYNPITDVAIVCSKDKIPKGYHLVTSTCEESVVQLKYSISQKHTKEEPRYLCFSREKQRDDLVVVGLKMTKRKKYQMLQEEGYSVITNTIEGEKPFEHHRFGIKRIPRRLAVEAVSDIYIKCSKSHSEQLPPSFIKLKAVNSSVIAYKCDKLSAYKPKEKEKEKGKRKKKEKYKEKQKEKEKKKADDVDIASIPITNVIFVGSLDNLPRGYIPIKKCDCGKEINLGKKASTTRYLCYSKMTKGDSFIIKDMYVEANFNYTTVRDHYSVVSATVEGEQSLKFYQFCIQRILKDFASNVITDIVIYCKACPIPKGYYQLTTSIHKFRIAFKTHVYDSSKMMYLPHRDSCDTSSQAVSEHSSNQSDDLFEEKPVSDIVFVCSPDKAPAGYFVVDQGQFGHDANLWPKLWFVKQETRYIGITRKKQPDDKIIEDMFIPAATQQYMKAGYKIITDTVEGEEPMLYRQMAVKRVPKDEAEIAVVDVIVCRTQDVQSIPSDYRALRSVNNCTIAIKQAKRLESFDILFGDM